MIQAKNTVRLMKPYSLQNEVLTHPARFKVVIFGRRAGKTETGKIAVGETVIKDKEQVFWFSPSYQMSSQIWREMKETFRPLIKWKSEQDRIIEFVGGGELRVFSAEKFDRVRGLSPRRIIFDEAAMMTDPDIWYAASAPSLADKRGDAFFLTTPRGRNWLYDIYQKGLLEEDGYKSWNAPSWVNPYMAKSEFIRAKKSYPERLFAQEFKAEFIEDASGVFSGVGRICTAWPCLPYKGVFSMGVDLARKDDYTVIVIFDVTQRQMVYMERLGSMDWHVQRERIKDVYNKWSPKYAWVEENNVGDVIVQDLQRQGVRVQPFYTSSKTKPEIIERLAMGIRNKEVEFLNDKDLLIEFQAYQLNITGAGNITYSAPAGFHDDIVMATAIAYQPLSLKNMIHGGALRKHRGWVKTRRI